LLNIIIYDTVCMRALAKQSHNYPTLVNGALGVQLIGHRAKSKLFSKLF